MTTPGDQQNLLGDLAPGPLRPLRRASLMLTHRSSSMRSFRTTSKSTKGDEKMLVEAKALVKKAYSEVLCLEEECLQEGAVNDETDFFKAGGSEYIFPQFIIIGVNITLLITSDT